MAKFVTKIHVRGFRNEKLSAFPWENGELWSGQTQKVLAGVAVGLVLAHGDVVVEDVDALQALIGEAGASSCRIYPLANFKPKTASLAFSMPSIALT